MIKFRVSVLLHIGFAFEESATATENWVIADMTQMVSQVVHAVQSAVTIPASKGRNHCASEWVGEGRNAYLIGIGRGSQRPLRNEHTYLGRRSNRNLRHR